MGFLKFAFVLGMTLVFSACNRGNEHLARATALYPEGRAIFERYNCARCHNEGEGGFGKRLIGNANLQNLEYIEQRVREGKVAGDARMPPFSVLKPEELQNVAQFVRALAGWK